MKRAVIAGVGGSVVVLAVFALVILPLRFGMLLEKRFHSGLEALGKNFTSTGLPLVIIEKKYHRRLTTSHALVTLGIRDGAHEIPFVVLESALYHGPFPARTAGDRGRFPAWRFARLETTCTVAQGLNRLKDHKTREFIDGLGKATASTVISLGGVSATHFVYPSLEISKGRAAVTWAGFSGDLDLAVDLSSGRLAFSTADFNLGRERNGRNEFVRFGNIKMSVDVRKTTENAGSYDGDFKLRLDRASFKIKEVSAELRELELLSEVKRASRASGAFSISLGGLNLSTLPAKVTGFICKVAFVAADPVGMQRMLESAAKTETLGKLLGLPETLRFKEAIARLFHGSTCTIDTFRFLADGQESELSAEVRWADEFSFSQLERDPKTIFKTVQARVNVSADKKFVALFNRPLYRTLTTDNQAQRLSDPEIAAEFQKVFDVFTAENLFQDQNGRITAQAEIREGKFFLNGEEMDDNKIGRLSLSL